MEDCGSFAVLAGVIGAIVVDVVLCLQLFILAAGDGLNFVVNDYCSQCI